MTKMKRVLMMGALMMALTSVSVGAFAATTIVTCQNIENCPYNGECPADNLCAAPGTGRGHYRRVAVRNSTARTQRGGCHGGHGCR